MCAYDFRFSIGNHTLLCVAPNCIRLSDNSIDYSIHCSFSSVDDLYRPKDFFGSWRAVASLLEEVTYLWVNFRDAFVMQMSISCHFLLYFH